MDLDAGGRDGWSAGCAAGGTVLENLRQAEFEQLTEQSVGRAHEAEVRLKILARIGGRRLSKDDARVRATHESVMIFRVIAAGALAGQNFYPTIERFAMQ